ncbi:hypothetical protein MW887_004414 [Aspergillus wentii]|nr:hypothetical protein MW887_004414 [Aspergillus wentii]
MTNCLPKDVSKPDAIVKETDDGSRDIERAATTDTTAHGSTHLIAPAVDAGYHRSLTRRQIMMMTFGAGIGTGLWVGTGEALRYAGPAGVAVTYTITAMIVYAQYSSIGEMTVYKPIHGGFIRQCAEYVDPAFGFAIGVNFWFAWVMIIPAEITAAVSVLKFWPETNAVPLAAYITIFLAVIVFANVFHVRVYGMIEYWMSFIKCLAVVLMIFFMFIMTSGGIAATGGPIEFRYWKSPGAINNGIKGIAKAFVQAAFSFGGGEHIAVIAGEVAEPRRTLKKTVRPVFWRMFTFFVVNVWLVGMCVPSDDDDLVNASGTMGSPFVIAIKRANVGGLADVINGFIFLSVISCGITSAFRNGLRAQGVDLRTLPFKGLLTPWAQYLSLLIVLFVFGCEFYLSCWPFGEKGSVKSFFSSYLAAPLFFFDYFVYKFYFKTKIVKPMDMGFDQALAFDEQDRFDAMTKEQRKEREQSERRTWVQRAQYMVFG